MVPPEYTANWRFTPGTASFSLMVPSSLLLSNSNVWDSLDVDYTILQLTEPEKFLDPGP